MRKNELTTEQKTKATQRAENAQAILADFEQQHGFELPAPWHECIKELLHGGLGDPELHLIFKTYARVEHAAGCMAEKPIDYAAWAAEEQ